MANSRSDPAKKCYTLSISEEEIEKQLSIIFDPQICLECGQDHSFRYSFEDVMTSRDDFLKYFTMSLGSISVWKEVGI
jgi:hypothetical protein